MLTALFTGPGSKKVAAQINRGLQDMVLSRRD